MTWWYRWLCRLSGVLGAVCEYPARGRGRSCRTLRMRVRPRPRGRPPWHLPPPGSGRLGVGVYGPRVALGSGGGGGKLAPLRLLWFPARGLGSWVWGWRAAQGTFQEGTTRPRLPLHGSSEREGSATPTPGAFRDCPDASAEARAQSGPEAASPVDLGVGAGGSRLNLWAKVVYKWGGCWPDFLRARRSPREGQAVS